MYLLILHIYLIKQTFHLNVGEVRRTSIQVGTLCAKFHETLLFRGRKRSINDAINSTRLFFSANLLCLVLDTLKSCENLLGDFDIHYQRVGTIAPN